MSDESRLNPLECSENAQEFLFASAFWAVAADEKLTTEEQGWLAEQFGAEQSQALLGQISTLDNDAFFKLFDDLVGVLSDDDKRTVYPALASWIVSCIVADGVVDGVEETVAEEIMRRANVEAELVRLESGGAADAETEDVSAAPVPSGELQVRTLSGHVGSLNDVAFSPDGARIISASEDGTAKLWAISGEEEHSLELHSCGVTAAAFLPDGTAVTADRMGEVICWDSATGEKKAAVKLQKQGGISGLSCSPDGSRILAASEVGTLTVLRTADLSEECRLGEKHSGIVHDAVYSPDGSKIASGGDDSKLRVWSADGTLIKTLEGHDAGIMSIRFTSDGKKLVSGSRDNSVRLWDVGTGEQIKAFEGHTFTVYGVCVSPDDRFIFSGSADHTAKLWDIASGQMIRSYEQYTSGFACGAFSPDGRLAVMAGTDNLLYIFENFV